MRQRPCWCTMLVYQTNPVGVQLFSYVNTFFCHVGVPHQSCGSSTLFLCKHFLLSCWCTKQILWEFNSFFMWTLSCVMLMYLANPVWVQLFSYVNTFFCHIGLPKNPGWVQLFSYVNTFFCHVGLANQSCGSSTLFSVNTFFFHVDVPSQSCGSSTLFYLNTFFCHVGVPS